MFVAANQQGTHDWWRKRRHDFDLFVSALVVKEAKRGDGEAAKARLDVLSDIDVLETSRDAVKLAEDLVLRQALPQKALEDALHIAIATTNGVDYLLTWNFRHIANAAMKRQIDEICRDWDYEPPIICSPPALLED